MPQTFYQIKYKLDGKIKEDTYSGPAGLDGANSHASKLKEGYATERFEFVDIHDLHGRKIYLTASDWQP